MSLSRKMRGHAGIWDLLKESRKLRFGLWMTYLCLVHDQDIVGQSDHVHGGTEVKSFFRLPNDNSRILGSCDGLLESAHNL